jgi:hypothetical protein
MRALVVHESLFGNTRHIAEAIAEGLRAGPEGGAAPAAAGVGGLEVEVVGVTEAPPTIPAGVELLVVGGPTHAFGLSRPSTRHSAGEQGAPPELADGAGMREWLGALEPSAAHLAAAAFDTHIDRPHLPGAASHAAERRLRKLGFTMLVPGESFFVEDVEGPLIAGEHERAVRFGRQLAARMASRPAASA